MASAMSKAWSANAFTSRWRRSDEPKGYDVYGVDSIDENVEEARRLHPEIAQRVSVADLRKPLGHPDASFDFVLCNAVIQHIAPDTVQANVMDGATIQTAAPETTLT